MRKFLWLFAVVLNFCLAYGQAPPWQWANDANSPGNEYGWDVISDTVSASIYVGGKFNGNLSAKFGASFSASYGSDDGFLAKYTDAGAFLWAVKIGGSNEDEIRSVAVDPSGNVYASGTFKGTADFDPTAGTFTLTSNGGLDGFLAKYSPAGTLIWAVKYGGGADDESWKMYADANGIFITGYYSNAPATFSSFSSVVTKTTFSNAGGGADMFGAKYNSSGIIQWVVSGGGNKIDCGYSVVADAGKVYFIGGYNANANFMDASGTSQTTLQAQQNNKEQVFIVAYDQAGNFSWQNNITCTTNKEVVGWTIAQDASNLYVSGYMEDNVINFQYPSPSFTQSISSGGGLDIFLAKLSKSGTFTWRTSVTGSGSGEQVGRALEINSDGDVILSGNFKNNLDYTAAGGPLLTASAYDIFIAAYSNAGTFKWAAKAGNTGDDVVNGTSAGKTRSIYLTGDHASGAIFGTFTLTPGGGDNIYVARIGCNGLANNTITSTQTVCAGNTPSTLNGSVPTGSGPYVYNWQQSANNTIWINATGTFTNQNYSPAAITASTYYRRIVTVAGACSATLVSTSLLISVDQPPSTSVAGSTQTLCSSSATLAANTPTTGTGFWTVATGTATVVSPSVVNSTVNGLSNGSNKFVWTISNGTCPSSTSTVTIMRDVNPTTANAGASQTLCASSATLAGNAPTTGTGLWSVNTGTATVSNPSVNNSAVNGLSNGSNKFVWTISNGTCPSSTSTVTIMRDANPTAANAGTSQTLCTSSATLAGNIPTTGTGLWSVNAGTATVSNPSVNNSAVNGLSNGSNKFVWTISNGTCPSSTSTVTIMRDANPTVANAGASQTLCTSSATLAGNIPTTGTGLWAVNAGTATVSNPSLNNSAVSGLSNGSNKFVWTISNGTCPSSTSTVTIMRDVNPTISNAGTSQTLCTSSVTLSGNIPTTGTGLWAVNAGTATVSNPSLNNSAVNGLSNGSNQFVWTISNGTCPSSTSTVTIMRDVNPTISNAGTSQTLCASSATLSGNIPITGTGLWSVGAGTATISNPSLFNSSVTGLSTGTNNFIWTISNGTCPSSTSTVTIMRDANPTVSNAGTSQTLCTSSATLAGNIPTTGTGLWSVNAGTATVSNPSVNNSAVSGLSNGSNKFVWTISNGTCPSSTSTVTIMRDVNPTISNAGTSQTLCASSATLSGNVPTTGTGLWSVNTGTATVSNPSLNTSAVNGLSNGSNKFVWTISNGTCPSSTSTVTIMRDVNPTISNAGTSQTLCASSATLAGNAPTTGTGFWTVATGTATVVSPSVANSTVNGLSNGSNKFVWTISNGTCPSSTSTVTIVRDVNSTISNAGASQTLCAASATLSGNIPSTGTGLWSVGSGTATISNPSLSNSSVTGLSTGTNNFIWSISNGTCPSSSSTVTVMKDANPTTASAGTSQTLCTSSATLAGNAPTTGTGLWSVSTGTANVSNPSLNNSTVTGLSTGSNNLVWTISNGSCPSSSSTVTVMKDANPTVADAGTSQTLCAASATLSGNVPSTGTGLWSVSTGTGTIVNSTAAVSGVNGLSTGANDFIWTISNGTCPSSSSTVSVTKDANPTTANAGTSQTLCVSSATLSGNIPTTGTGIWSVSAGTATVVNPSLNNSLVTGLNTGTNDFTWTISNGTCPASSSTVTVMRDANPTVSNAGTSQTLCASSATLAGNIPVTGIGIWYVATGTATIANPSSAGTAVNGLNTGINNFVWTISNGVCPASTATVAVMQDLPPTASTAGSSQTVCTTATTLNANTPSVGSGAWSVVSGNAAFSVVNNPAAQASSLAAGVNVLSWTISNGVCAASVSTVSVYKEIAPTPANAGSDQVICNTTATLNANTPAIGNGSWTVAQGGASVSQPNSASTFATLGIGQNSFVWSIVNGSCPASHDTVIIIRDTLPTLANAGPDQLICSTTSSLNANIPVIGSGSWTSLSGNGFSSSSQPATTVTTLNTGTNTLVWSITNGSCPASRDTLIIHVDAQPSDANAGNDQRICSDALTLSAIQPVTGSGSWQLISGPGIISDLSLYNASLSGISSGTTTLLWITRNGVCPAKNDELVIVRDLMPDTAKAGDDQATDYPVAMLLANAPHIGTGSWTVISGAAEIEDLTAFKTQVKLSEGENAFRWTIVNGSCPSSTDDIVVFARPLAIPNAFSPNNDGINDAFVIPGIDYYDGIKFNVFNRWGGLIYSNSNYKNDWTGLNTANEVIAEDTYYYTLEMVSGKTHTGFIIVKRGK